MRRPELVFWSLAGAVVYTYAGYPLILSLLARRRGQPAEPTSRVEPAVSLIIAAYNEQDVIARKLQNCLMLDYPSEKLEIIVAADGSDDRTVDEARSFATDGVRVSFSSERRGKVAAINRAVAVASGEVLVFSDANNMYDASAVRELVRPFAEPDVGGVVGSKHVAHGDGGLGDSEGLYWRYESHIQRMESRLGSCTAAVGEILAIRRSAFEAPPDGVICEDFYMVMRLLRRGHRVIYRPEARSVERVSMSPRDEMKRRANIVAGRFQAMTLAGHLLPFRNPRLVWQVLSHKFMRPLVPLAMIGMAASNVVLARGRSAWWMGSLAAQAAFYVVAVVGDRVVLPGPMARIAYVPTFLLNSNIAALMGLVRFLTNRGSMHLWERVERRSWDG